MANGGQAVQVNLLEQVQPKWDHQTTHDHAQLMWHVKHGAVGLALPALRFQVSTGFTS